MRITDKVESNKGIMTFSRPYFPWESMYEAKIETWHYIDSLLIPESIKVVDMRLKVSSNDKDEVLKVYNLWKGSKLV